jgi:hypothetical protein
VEGLMSNRKMIPGDLRYPGELALILLCLALLALSGTQPAMAHGGGTPQLTNAEAGPYLVSVWTEPDPIRVGNFHVTIAVLESPAPSSSERESGDPVLDAMVQVNLKPISETGKSFVAYATRENAVNKMLYEADLDLASEGQWRVDIQVEGPAGTGSTGFDIEAAPPSVFNAAGGVPWPVWAGGLGLALLGVGWSVLTFRSQGDRGPSITDQQTTDPSRRPSAVTGNREYVQDQERTSTI